MQVTFLTFGLFMTLEVMGQQLGQDKYYSRAGGSRMMLEGPYVYHRYHPNIWNWATKYVHTRGKNSGGALTTVTAPVASPLKLPRPRYVMY